MRSVRGAQPARRCRPRRRRRAGTRERWRGEEGNTLVLVPVAVLILLGLAAMALDGALLYLGQRRLADVAAAAATGAAGELDRAAFYDPEVPAQLNLTAGQERAAMLVADLGRDRGFEDVTCEVAVEELTATVRCEGTVRPMLAPFWPGLGAELRLAATERATARSE